MVPSDHNYDNSQLCYILVYRPVTLLYGKGRDKDETGTAEQLIRSNRKNCNCTLMTITN